MEAPKKKNLILAFSTLTLLQSVVSKGHHDVGVTKKLTSRNVIALKTLFFVFVCLFPFAQVRHHHQPVGDGLAAAQARALGGGHGVRREGLRLRGRERSRPLSGRPAVLRAAEQHLELHRVAHDR